MVCDLCNLRRRAKTYHSTRVLGGWHTLSRRFFDTSTSQFYVDVLALLELFVSHSWREFSTQFRAVGLTPSAGDTTLPSGCLFKNSVLVLEDR